jgi:hypothetical protein
MKIQSNGMGIQSVGMYLMSCLGELPRLDYSIFADPGAEKEKTYEYFEWLQNWSKKNNGIPLIHDKSKNLYLDLLNAKNSTGQKFAPIPAYTILSGEIGQVRRQCTNEYKIEVVNKKVMELQGLKKGQSFKPDTEIWLGISQDEFHRIFIPERKNQINVYPFCNYYRNKKNGWFGEFKPMTRGEIIQWLKKYNFLIPPKSSCVFCPFQHDRNWMKLNKQEFKVSISIDEAIRDISSMGNLNGKMYLHKSCLPIEKVNFDKDQIEINFDCYGYCDV